jgi:hypothetical protein
MKTYDRANFKQIEKKEQVREEREPWWDYEDLWDFFHSPYNEHITMDDVRRGWLMGLLIKLGLKTPKEKIKDLNW